MEAEAIYNLAHLSERTVALRRQLASMSAELDQLKSRRAENAIVLETCASTAARIAHGNYRGPRDHLRLPQMPTSAADLRLSRLAEVWAAVSVGLLLLSLFVISLVAEAWEVGLLALLAVYIFIEALFRRQVQMLIRYAVVTLAIITSLVLVIEFFWPLFLILVLLAGLFIIWENVRELRTSGTRKP
jgi:membrane-bound ClpP family serine protease